MPSPDTEEIIVTAALELMNDQGIDEPSILEICKRAGFARATFYEHFPDREALLSAVLRRLVGDFVAESLVVDPPGDLEKIVQNFMLSLASPTTPLRGTATWRFRHTLDACARRSALRARYVEVMDQARRQLRAQLVLGQRDGRVRADIDADALAGLLLTLAYGSMPLLELEFSLDYAGIARAVTQMARPV
ncbi:MAG: TetR/AcrR family transcriptional regulator [Deltaproteobacteria bacterium]|nr:TetR/AcrR family transcriptional regulator [Deltaproteobacteria bacterium]